MGEVGVFSEWNEKLSRTKKNPLVKLLDYSDCFDFLSFGVRTVNFELINYFRDLMIHSPEIWGLEFSSATVFVESMGTGRRIA